MADRRLRIAAAALPAYVVLSVIARRSPPRGERMAVRRANHDGMSHGWLWPAQQVGTPWVLPGTAVVGGVVMGVGLGSGLSGLIIPADGVRDRLSP
ncbi:hypothetical protein ncot_05265 [Nocardioides sp. JQ2195]|uniref:hypothetical protein n=1 Tax=Nocardioides sp. JQ2195 TaxID=2592334 RepID=UPI00143E98C3|nr:hypothetical protein [Nocardioides sp. JQ2195]QIX26075.1 hypothetical protein ncot_05265 [Nocardioides sp. JQ2195]